jgi:polyphosphate kinase
MDRNFFRRIEVCLPILDQRLKKRVVDEGLRKYLDDNSQAWEMDAEGRYERAKPGKGEAPRTAQIELLQELASALQPEPESAAERMRPRRKAKAAA